ncbi:MAG: hypothetical protein EHM71_07235 [Zetaproteobacteria bacterium]|nr:MAG: hypothetical protein EHM71_07235 [Zetaproteobacteria bacterium]
MTRHFPGRESLLLRRHTTRCAVVACLLLVAATCVGASFERYLYWLRTTEAVAGEPVRKVDRWTAYCRVKPWSQGCRTATPATSIPANLAVSTAAAAPAIRGDWGSAPAGSPHFTLAAPVGPPSAGTLVKRSPHA